VLSRHRFKSVLEITCLSVFARDKRQCRGVRWLVQVLQIELVSGICLIKSTATRDSLEDISLKNSRRLPKFPSPVSMLNPLLPPWTPKALDQSRADRIVARGHDDWNSRGCLFRSHNSGVHSRNDHIDVGPNQIRREIDEPLEFSIGPSAINYQVLTQDVSMLAHRQFERIAAALTLFHPCRPEIADTVNFERLLCIGRRPKSQSSMPIKIANFSRMFRGRDPVKVGYSSIPSRSLTVVPIGNHPIT
jgi:hypothetical protein